MNNRTHDRLAFVFHCIVWTCAVILLIIPLVASFGCSSPRKPISTTPVNWQDQTPAEPGPIEPTPDPLPNAPETLVEFTAWFAEHRKTCPQCGSELPDAICEEAFAKLQAVMGKKVESPTAAEGTAPASQPLSDTDISAEAGRAEHNPACDCGASCKCGDSCPCGLTWKRGEQTVRIAKGKPEIVAGDEYRPFYVHGTDPDKRIWYCRLNGKTYEYLPVRCDPVTKQCQCEWLECSEATYTRAVECNRAQRGMPVSRSACEDCMQRMGVKPLPNYSRRKFRGGIF